MKSWVTWCSAHVWATAAGNGTVLPTHSCEVRKLTLSLSWNNKRSHVSRLIIVSPSPSHEQISALLKAWPTKWTRNSPSATTKATWWTAPAMDRDVDAGSVTLLVRLKPKSSAHWKLNTLDLRIQSHLYLLHPNSSFVFYRSVSGATNQSILPDWGGVGQNSPWHPLPLLLLWQRDWRNEMWTSADLPG